MGDHWLAMAATGCWAVCRKLPCCDPPELPLFHRVNEQLAELQCAMLSAGTKEEKRELKQRVKELDAQIEAERSSYQTPATDAAKGSESSAPGGSTAPPSAPKGPTSEVHNSPSRK